VQGAPLRNSSQIISGTYFQTYEPDMVCTRTEFQFRTTGAHTSPGSDNAAGFGRRQKLGIGVVYAGKPRDGEGVVTFYSNKT
jgi:hypothetical protein